MSTVARGKREDVLLLSIEPAFANQIYQGEKKFEFRKTPLPTDIEYVVLVEKGSREITGGFEVSDIHIEEIEQLWQKYGEDISEQDRFFEYYSGWDKGLAIKISNPERYERSVSIDELVETDPALEVPNQFHFVYMTNRTLRELSAFSEGLNKFLPNSKETTLDRYKDAANNLNYRPLKPSEENQFRELFANSPVPEDYLDINEGFIDHIIESHELGEDPYGYFTLKKEVYTLFANEDIIGFTTLTWKRGGSVKYGPTMLKKEARGKGYGPKLRKLIDSGLGSKGVRKTYSTIPEIAQQAFRYLIKSGYKVEAHLYRQYTDQHSELVFGKVLHEADPSGTISINRTNVDTIEVETGTQNFEGFREFVKVKADPWYNELNDEFVTSVQNAEERGLKSEFSKKGKRVFIGHTQGRVRCVAISSLKRGNAVKVSPILTDVVGEGLNRFIEHIEENLSHHPEIRKLYTHIPILDSDLTNSLRANGYRPEGVVREPYKEGIDMVVLAKMVV